MKKRIGLVAVNLLGFTLLLVSCASLQDRVMTPEERAESDVIGTVTTSWTSFSFLHIPPSPNNLRTRALSELKKEAVKQVFTGNYDIRNISVTQTASPWTFALVSYAIFMDFRKNTASGDVVLFNPSAGNRNTSQRAALPDDQTLQKNLDNAIASTCLMMADRLMANSTIAVLSVFSSNRNTSEYIIGELEYHFVNTGKFRIVDRRRLDQIRNEQNFQISGDVSDDSAVSIGNMLGANIVITGELTGAGSDQRLMLKAIDVQTAQIIAMSREQL